MSWRTYAVDTISGRILYPIDLPNFSWSVSVNDSSLSTTKSKGAGQDEVSGLKVPWTAVPANSPDERSRLLAPDRRSIALCWTSPLDDEDAIGTPILCGPIGQRKDGPLDTDFSLNSIYGLLGDRYLVREGVYGAGQGSTSTDIINLSNLSLRAIAAEAGWLCTNAKPGGGLPIDWHYRGERGSHQRGYDSWDIQNLKCSDVWDKIANVENGPDLQLRPRLSGDTIRFDFIAGSDVDPDIAQSTVIELSSSPHGGTLENMTIDHLGAVNRVYASGSGTDKAQLCHLSEDLSLVNGDHEPFPLREITYSDTDAADVTLLRRHADGILNANRRPLMQIKGELHANDADTNGTPLHPLGSFWPGETMKLDVQGFPSLSDGVYECRLMQISGDQSDKVSLTFDAMEDPMA